MDWYDHQEIEKKWQEYWSKHPFVADDFSDKEKFYLLFEFPYPSGDGLHVGHLRSYTALDVVARKLRMQGKNVLFPIGWDAYGLPTENYALKTGIHPRVATDQNIATFRKQMHSIGLSLDWSREFDTTDPKYYKWTQWIFLQLFKNKLAHQATIPINWCPKDKTGLANEEVVQGKCERCGTDVIRKEQKQWLLKITAYADRLIDDLKLVDFPKRVKTQQDNWIGRSEGAEIQFQITNSELQNADSKREGADPYPRRKQEFIKVFTTRPDTIFGATYMVLAPEHPLVEKYKLSRKAGSRSAGQITNYEEVEKYIEGSRKKSDLDRTDLAKEKTGVELKGLKAINPANGENIPMWIADYVLPHYGTGAIMAVPAHDERDWEFAKKFGLKVRRVIVPAVQIQTVEQSGSRVVTRLVTGATSLIDDPNFGEDNFVLPYVGEGSLINSGKMNGTHSTEAISKVTAWLEEKGVGKKSVTYKLRDWIFSRQHYWGEPIPIIHCPVHGAVAVPEKDLPVELPYVKKYEPTDTGESPLANIPDFVNVKCPACGKPAKRETDTMPNWAGSSWYYLRYCDPHNDKKFADKKKLDYWLSVDLYNGGMEHTTLHLLYSRFWHKFLFDQGLVPEPEPYKKRVSHGMILGEDGRKMSKSFGNVANPDDLTREYGADSLRVYEMFMGPYEDMIPWSTRGIIGVHRFLQSAWDLFENAPQEKSKKDPAGIEQVVHATIASVTKDIDTMRFNTAVSLLMILVNTLKAAPYASAEQEKWAKQSLLQLLYPFAPHLASELWEKKFGGNIADEPWPVADESKRKKSSFTLVVQVNGKVRAKLSVPSDIDETEATKAALAEPNVRKYVWGEPKKVVFVPGRLVNILV